MKNLNAEISLTTLIKIPLKSVFLLKKGDAELGYVAAEETLNDGKAVTTFTPFTSAGTLTEIRCFVCAIESLVERDAGVSDFRPCDRRDQPRRIIIQVISAGLSPTPLH